MEAAKSNPLGTKPVGSLLRQFAVPSIIAMLVSSLYNMVDQFFIGRSVGMLGNAATNVAFPLSITCTAVSLLCGVGGAANFNLSMGAGKEERAEKFAGTAITMMVVIGAVLCIAVRCFLEPMMYVFGATDEILDYALTYTGITSLGFPFLILSTGEATSSGRTEVRSFPWRARWWELSLIRSWTRCLSSDLTWAWRELRGRLSLDRLCPRFW